MVARGLGFVVVVSVVAWSMAGCDRSAPTVETWEVLESGALTAHQRAMADHAGRSRGLMGQRLMGTVMEAAEADGFGAAIEVCKAEAEPIAEEIGERQGVRIGRTSTKLRNPENQAPSWAVEGVEAGVEEMFFAVNQEGTLGAAIPIHLAAPCMNCHGSAQHLAPGVEEALAQHYPEDGATGYSKGDLRGWFWVEVPPDAVPARPAGEDGQAEEVQELSGGEALYVQYCAACHGRDGEGVPGAFPPLVGTERVEGDPSALIVLSLDGVSGPLEVLGESYNGFMPGQAQLSDEDMAELLTFVRGAWGNRGEGVSPERVAELRAETADRVSAWTQAELDELTASP